MKGQELQKNKPHKVRFILMNYSNNIIGDYMILCKCDCIYQSEGVCLKEKISPNGNNSQICPSFIDKSKNGFDSFPDIFNGNYFN